MKSKILFFSMLLLIYAVNTTRAQQPVYPKPNGPDQIPFGTKLPPPSLNSSTSGGLSTNFDPINHRFGLAKQNGIKTGNPSTLALSRNGSTVQSVDALKNATYGFHLTKDINTHRQPLSSYPNNTRIYPNEDNFYLSFAVLDNISYFAADDGIHGSELWRSDGTTEGTFMVKDINPGAGGSNTTSIIAANGKLYFSAYTDDTGVAPWVSDGTEDGTKLIKNIGGIPPNYQIPMVKVNNTIFFSANSDFGSKLWKTDGTPEGTSLVYDFNATDQYAGYITEPTAAGGLLFFSAWTPTYGRELWRSDGTEAGTFLVKDIGPDQSDYYSPLQLTEYNNKLYFSGDDGTGRKLWVSDGTAEGTTNVSGNNNDVYVQTDFLDYTFNFPFAVLNNVLYFAGNSLSNGNGLYKYDASNADGVALVKDLTEGTDVDFIAPTALIKSGNALYFKVINSIGGYHDDLWTSDGTTENTQIVKAFDPGHVTTNYYDGYGTLYFNEDDPTYGTELWKSDGTDGGTNIVKDIFPGNGGSGPAFLTPCNGKILFNATDPQYGAELWATDGTDMGTVLVKDINAMNSPNTDGSDAGFQYRGLSPLGNGVVFNAFTPQLGGELYKSDGTPAGTKLLNDIATGTDWSYPNDFLNEGKFSYFIADDATGTALYRTDGTTAGLKRITYIDRSIYYVVNFSVTDNGLLFYILGNKNTGGYELWRSNGTDAGSYVLNANIYYNDYVITIGNTGFFVAGDDANGYELWKSDGTVAGTKLVKDINPGFNGSYPYSLYAFKNNLYFGAYDGTGLNNSFWKSDGTKKGTVKLSTVTPAYFYETFADPAIQVYCISNDKLYFSATDFNNYGAELWVTNGNANGTKMVKDINPTFSSYPNYLTDVKGTLYFTADDGVHGTELWSTNGKPKGTNMVKDITPGYGSYLYNLCSAGGKLYFLNGSVFPPAIWSSDGTESNTNQVADAGLNGLSNIRNLTPSGNKLFFGAYTDQYGTELYEGDASASNFAAAPIAAVNKSDVNIASKDIAGKFDAIVYPNPTNSTSSLQIKGNTKDVGVSITDMTGKVVWQMKGNNSSKINLPIEKLSAGVYMIKVESGADKKILKLLKE